MSPFLFGLRMAYFAAPTAAYLVLIGLLVLIIPYFYSTAYRKRKTRLLLEDKIRKRDDLIRHLENENRHCQEERKMLVKEMHDRVINNLQIVASLLNTQSAYLKNDDALHAISISQQRLHAISLIYHILNQSEDFSTLNIRNYTYLLVEYLVDKIGGRKKIHFDIQIEGIYLDLPQAVPVGLIVHEAVTNAITYAFPGERRGIISVHMIRKQQGILMTISDNGVGLLFDYDVHMGNTLGVRLMEGLARQLDGHFKLENKSGVKIEVLFADIQSPESG